MNLDPGIVPLLPIALPATGTGADAGTAAVAVSVRVTVPSRLAGNGIGRPAAAWDLDLQVNADAAGHVGLTAAALRLQ